MTLALTDLSNNEPPPSPTSPITLSTSSSTPLNYLPKELLEEIHTYLDKQSKTALKTTNLFFNHLFPKLFFQYQASDLDSAFKSHLLIRQDKFLAFKDGQFYIEHLDCIKRIFRKLFGCYKETHLKTVTNGCSLIAAKSQLNLENSRDRAILKGIKRKLLDKSPVSTLSKYLEQDRGLYVNIQNSLTISCEEEDLIGSLDVEYSQAYGIATNFGIKVRFTLNTTKEYVHFIVMDPISSNLHTCNGFMELGTVCQVHAADGQALDHTHAKYANLCNAAYKIAQSIALKAHVDIIVPAGIDFHTSDILDKRGFKLVNNRLYPHWKWTCIFLDDLPKVKINLEFTW